MYVIQKYEINKIFDWTIDYFSSRNNDKEKIIKSNIIDNINDSIYKKFDYEKLNSSFFFCNKNLSNLFE